MIVVSKTPFAGFWFKKVMGMSAGEVSRGSCWSGKVGALFPEANMFERYTERARRG